VLAILIDSEGSRETHCSAGGKNYVVFVIQNSNPAKMSIDGRLVGWDGIRHTRLTAAGTLLIAHGFRQSM